MVSNRQCRCGGHPDPDGTGRTTNNTNPTAHRQCRDRSAGDEAGRRDNHSAGANRAGFSMRCSIRMASPIDTTTIASRPAGPSGAPNKAGASSTGQCHRYHE